MTVASYSGTKFSRIREAQVVRTPRVQSTSLTARGMPVSGVALPAAMAASARSAWARAASGVTVR